MLKYTLLRQRVLTMVASLDPSENLLAGFSLQWTAWFHHLWCPHCLSGTGRYQMGSYLVLRSWAPFFIFWPTYFIPKTFLAIQPLIRHLPSSHVVPRSTTYPPGLPCHPSSPLATSFLLSYITLTVQMSFYDSTIPLGRYHQPIVHLNRELYCSFPIVLYF